MARKDTVQVRLPRNQQKQLKSLSEFTRVDMTDYMEEAVSVFLETRAPIYRRRREDEIKAIKAFSK